MKTSIRQALYGLGMLCAGLWAGEAVAVTAQGPICDSTAKVLCQSGTFGSYLDIGNNTCASWNQRGMLVGSYAYRYYGGCAGLCGEGVSCNGGMGNYYVVTGSNGWDFRMLYVYPNASSGSKTCDRCALGLVGVSGGAITLSHVHSENRQYGTRSTAWFTSVVHCGSPGSIDASSGYCGNVVGYPTL